MDLIEFSGDVSAELALIGDKKAVTESAGLGSLSSIKRGDFNPWICGFLFLLAMSPAVYGWARDCWRFALGSVALLALGAVVLYFRRNGQALDKKRAQDEELKNLADWYARIPQDYRRLRELQEICGRQAECNQFVEIVNRWVEKAHVIVTRMLEEPQAPTAGSAQQREIVEAWYEIDAFIGNLTRLLGR